MALEVQGTVVKVMNEVTGEGKNGPWKKREFVIETQSQYPKKICFEAWGANAETASTLRESDLVKVAFEPESREYMDKWYTGLRAYKIDRATGAAPASSAPAPAAAAFPTAPPDFSATEPTEADDLPF